MRKVNADSPFGENIFMSIAIVTDSNCGITVKQAEELGIEIQPTPLIINGEMHFEEEGFTQEQFYDALTDDKTTVATSQPNPYDVAEGVDTTGDGQPDEGSLRGSSELVAERIREKIQSKVSSAGLEIVEARITYLAYSPEIAAAMLQRQQATAIIDARKMIVDGAVGMVEMALERLNSGGMVTLDEERKAAMVSNLLVVLCGNKDAQPIVNSGSLY